MGTELEKRERKQRKGGRSTAVDRKAGWERVKEPEERSTEENGIRGDLISDRIERSGQVGAVNSGAKKGRNLYFVTREARMHI